MVGKLPGEGLASVSTDPISAQYDVRSLVKPSEGHQGFNASCLPTE